MQKALAKLYALFYYKIRYEKNQDFFSCIDQFCDSS